MLKSKTRTTTKPLHAGKKAKKQHHHNKASPQTTTKRFNRPPKPRAQKGGSAQLSEEDLTKTAEKSAEHSYALSHTVYSNIRDQDFAAHKAKYPHFTPYPDKIESTISIAEFANKYNHIENGARLREETPVTINARVHSRRVASSKLSFFDLYANDADLNAQNVQLIASAFNLNEESLDVSKIVKQGDWVSVTGFPGKTDTGQLSIVAQTMTLLSPCLHYPPNQLTDPNLRFRHKHLDLLVNREKILNTYRIRSQIIFQLRQYLNQREFIEVETPILWTQSGGATARPFVTTSNAFGNDLDLSLRIAPELFLKQLVIGGLPRVYEIGKVFRNEGIDATHNPEFTSCELYQAHADYQTMMDFTEDVLRDIVKKCTGSHIVKILPPGVNAVDTPEEFKRLNEMGTEAEGVKFIDFAQPFKRLDVLQTLRDNGVELPPNFNSDEALPALREICAKRGWVMKPPYTVARCLDTMISEVIEPMCIQPTFITNQPLALSPLAKSSTANPEVAERFELFINTKEYANAYSELNVPTEQYDRFTAQHRIKQLKAGDQDYVDDEAHPVDTPYCEALTAGLPPTGGWGLGIDRLVMLLSQQQNIRDVIYFPIMKPQEQPQEKQQQQQQGQDKQ